MESKIKVILSDFSYTLLFPKTKDNVSSLNGLYNELVDQNKSVIALNHFIINQELLNFFKTLKNKYKLYIFTSSNIHADQHIAKLLDPVFDGAITSTEIKLPKSYPDAYKVVANKLGIDVEEILFIDDLQKNVDAAITAGAHAIRYTNNSKVKAQMKKILQPESDLNGLN